MRKIVSIILGWWFWITNRNNLMAAERLQVCAHCDFRKGTLCGICGCVLEAKARLKEEDCPLGQWSAYYIWFSKQIDEFNKK